MKTGPRIDGKEQYYTRPEAAAHCVEWLMRVLPGIGGPDPGECWFIEPSAGRGDFFDRLPPDRRIGLDLEPHHSALFSADFLDWEPNACHGLRRETTIVCGNPPYGYRCRLAIRFFNRAAMFADTIAFVVPYRFRRYSVHKWLAASYRLVDALRLKPDSFYVSTGKVYSISSEFQLWTRLPVDAADMRITRAPRTTHPDWHSNIFLKGVAHRRCFKYLKERWDFAVPCQGFVDYTQRETDMKNIVDNGSNWMMYRCRTPEVYRRLWNLDYGKLAARQTVKPGFSKADVVREYIDIYGEPELDVGLFQSSRGPSAS